MKWPRTTCTWCLANQSYLMHVLGCILQSWNSLKTDFLLKAHEFHQNVSCKNTKEMHWSFFLQLFLQLSCFSVEIHVSVTASIYFSEGENSCEGELSRPESLNPGRMFKTVPRMHVKAKTTLGDVYLYSKKNKMVMNIPKLWLFHLQPFFLTQVKVWSKVCDQTENSWLISSGSGVPFVSNSWFLPNKWFHCS